MKVTLKEWNAVATWHWDMPEDEVCGICRVQFDGTCPTCKFPGDDCALLIGKCGHSFHMNSSGSKKKNNGLGDLAYLHIILSRQAFNGLIQ
ncbi:uncharacterized protein N7458_000118 [Penicillium daleae]|uniref:Anaphase-promoting complex subunit 11 RING-H2 finger domain-containing protein n=1 Tax=Penicillium daleae TaxID=63821 RepID=A0AAD6CFP8_9EURO|nr:uncharacterized protein N7458_000118 [Penicillium daleae]KAJ5464432.1 hypothetical protein N7458_000118 [Penicillium daleae]